jgi:hypothetical protein
MKEAAYSNPPRTRVEYWSRIAVRILAGVVLLCGALLLFGLFLAIPVMLDGRHAIPGVEADIALHLLALTLFVWVVLLEVMIILSAASCIRRPSASPIRGMCSVTAIVLWFQFPTDKIHEGLGEVDAGFPLELLLFVGSILVAVMFYRVSAWALLRLTGFDRDEPRRKAPAGQISFRIPPRKPSI